MQGCVYFSYEMIGIGIEVNGTHFSLTIHNFQSSTVKAGQMNSKDADDIEVSYCIIRLFIHYC